MCEDCWSKYGKPTIDNQLVRQLRDAIEIVYGFNPAGGSLHIILDEWNIEDSSIEFCERYIAENPTTVDEDSFYRHVLSLLREATLEERASALAMYHGFTPQPQSDAHPN